MTDEMKPVKCGCGGEAIAYIQSMDGGFWHLINVSCSKCGISTPKYDTEAEAITAWNRAMGADQFRDVTKKIERTAKVNVNYRDESVVFGFCECGQAVNTYSTYCPHCGARLEWE